jgi:hypothetical protein
VCKRETKGLDALYHLVAFRQFPAAGGVHAKIMPAAREMAQPMKSRFDPMRLTEVVLHWYWFRMF